jgi:predicted transcriptional regulator
MNIGNLIKNTKKLFFNLARVWNDTHATREESNPRGFNGNQINNEEQIGLAIAFFCKEIGRNKIGKNGILKVTRTFIAQDIKRSTPTVDRYLEILQALGFIKTIERGLCQFKGGNKAINCLYITINWEMFVLEAVQNVIQNIASYIANFQFLNTLQEACGKILKTASKRE